MPHIYNRDYSVTEIKRFIADSEKRPHPFNPTQHGHAFSKHHGISDADAIAQNKSAFIISQATNGYLDTLDPADLINGGIDPQRLAMLRIYTRTSADQPFMVAAVLNTPFGQAALKAISTSRQSRLTIHAKPAGKGIGGAMKMRVVQAGAVTSGQAIAHVVIIIDNGLPDPHFVTAYPTNNGTYKFKFGPQTPRTRPGIELVSKVGNTQRKSAYVWTKDRQEDGDGVLNLVHLA